MRRVRAEVFVFQTAVAVCLGILAAVTVLNGLEKRRQRRLCRRGMEMLYPDAPKHRADVTFENVRSTAGADRFALVFILSIVAFGAYCAVFG